MEPEKQFWQSSSGKKLFAWHIKPAATPKAIILIVHGHGEHSLRYVPWAKRFAYHGFIVQSWDHIGHGQSEGRRGHIRYFEQLLFEIRHARTDQRLVNRDAFRRWRKRNGSVRTGIGEPLFGGCMNALSSLGDRTPIGV